MKLIGIPAEEKNTSLSARVLVFLLASVFTSLGSAQELRLDPSKVQGPDACGECHKNSLNSWKETHHATSFKSLPRSDKGREIAKKMGLKRIKAGSDCLTCHFTSAVVEDKTSAIAGTSCESCHGAGTDWVDIHSDFGGKGVKAENEDPEHKITRYAKSEAAGMIRPSDLYKLAENCYQCHTVPNENLVNVGGHPAGSQFELVRWTQGEVRHNVWYTEANNEAPLERRRMMFIVGQAIDLEFALRGVAKATKPEKYAKSMAKRAAIARKRIAAVSQLVDIPELKEITEVGKSAKLKLNNEVELIKAAEAVSAATKKLATNYDGSTLEPIDSMLPSADKYKGKPSP